MRMVIEVSDDLHASLKQRAREEDRPLARIVRELIKEYLERKSRERPPPPVG